jgi:hypothetical protein
MGVCILITSSLLTLILNLFLAFMLLKGKLYYQNTNENNVDDMSFTLIPTCKDINVDTEVLQTEIIVGGEYINGEYRANAAEE